MKRTESFRRQHEELSLLASEVLTLTKSQPSEDEANAVRKKLSVLAGKLSIHLAGG